VNGVNSNNSPLLQQSPVQTLTHNPSESHVRKGDGEELPRSKSMVSMGKVAARHLASCQRGVSGEEGKVLRPESVPDCPESSAARELGSTARKTSCDYYMHGSCYDPPNRSTHTVFAVCRAGIILSLV
jgi:hypothetical protein